MFGLVTASLEELTAPQRERYREVYCGICRGIGCQDGQLCRLGLSYDMVFLAMVLMSLYEPEETRSAGRCVRHPLKKQSRTDNEYVRYAARMNVALACYNARDDWEDDRKWSARLMEKIFGKNEEEIFDAYPAQCEAVCRSLQELSRLERENCPNPDEPANAFGELLGALMVVREDQWTECLWQMGFCLGRFIYLADAAMDYRDDVKKGKYNPFAAMGCGEDFDRWEQYLVLSMAGCTDAYERLPLVQDKEILDNILYSGVWLNYRAKQKRSGKENHNGGSL